MNVDDIPKGIRITPIEHRILEAEARRLDIALSHEQGMLLVSRMADMYAMVNNAARMAAVASMYAKVDSVHAGKIAHELAVVLCNFMIDPGLFTDQSRGEMAESFDEGGVPRPVEAMGSDLGPTTTTTQPPRDGARENVTQVDFVSRRKEV